MKNTLSFLFGIALTLAFVFFFTPNSTVHASPLPKAEDGELRVVFYTAIWNGCLTDIVKYRPDLESEIIEACKQSLQLALDNHFYENMNSDMFQPVPRSVLPMYKVNPNLVTFDMSTAKRYASQGYVGYTFSILGGGKLMLEIKNPQNKPGMIICKGSFDTTNILNKIFPSLGC
jgi:hypothetical protein